MSLFNEATVVRLDADSAEVFGTTTGTGGQPCGLATGAGSLWTADYRGGGVSRIDLATGDLQEVIPTGPAVYDVAFVADAAWASNYGDGTLARVDAATNDVTIIDVGGSPGGIAVSGGWLWVATGPGGEVVQVDPVMNAVVNTFDVGGTPTWMSFDDTSMFISDPTTGTVIQMDPVTGAVLGTTSVGGRPVDGDVAPDGTVWIPDLDGRLIYLGADGALLDDWDLDLAGPFVLDAPADGVWVANGRAPRWSGTTSATDDSDS